MARWLSYLRSGGAVLVGYGVIVLCTSLGFTPLGGIVHIDAPASTHLLATLVAVGSGIAGGMTAASISSSRPVAHAAGVLFFLVLDTAVVLGRPSPDPRWFELAGSATLMASTVAGGMILALLRKVRGQAPA